MKPNRAVCRTRTERNVAELSPLFRVGRVAPIAPRDERVVWIPAVVCRIVQRNIRKIFGNILVVLVGQLGVPALAQSTGYRTVDVAPIIQPLWVDYAVAWNEEC